MPNAESLMLSNSNRRWSRTDQIMNEPSVRKVEQKKNWTLTPDAFKGLLNWLDEGANSEGEKYLEMRRRLITYFDRKNCPEPDELADETLNRVARRLEEEGHIVSEAAARYCYIVARFVFLEYLRERNEEVPLDALSGLATTNQPAIFGAEDESSHSERLMTCLNHCTEKLDPQHRELIVRYYHGEQRIKINNRLALAKHLGITVNALSIRACRIRDKIEVCVRECAGTE
jgi:DNA-directed RNA polymerase specialized sigma24 family protein